MELSYKWIQPPLHAESPLKIFSLSSTWSQDLFFSPNFLKRGKNDNRLKDVTDSEISVSQGMNLLAVIFFCQHLFIPSGIGNGTDRRALSHLLWRKPDSATCNNQNQFLVSDLYHSNSGVSQTKGLLMFNCVGSVGLYIHLN